MTDNLNSFSYNILIANLHEMNNFMSREIINSYTKETIVQNYSKILITMLPIIPHFALECLEKNQFKYENKWPSYNKSLLLEENINFVVQINGKKRGLVKSKRDISEEDLLNEIQEDKSLIKYIKNKNFNKVIFIKNKLINIIV